MTQKEFYTTITNGKSDILALVLNVLNESATNYCLIGGLAVNAYVDPVISLDVDIIIAAGSTSRILDNLQQRKIMVEPFPHSINLSSPNSDLRIQIQTDPRYQEFIPRSSKKLVMGYEMNVADVKDVLQGKLWAYQDVSRRSSKRQKDLADIQRLIESFPSLVEYLPVEVKKRLEL